MDPATVSVIVSFGLFAGMLLFLEGGYRLGIVAQREGSPQEGVGALETAVYALLGLLLGFSFSGATSRFEEQRQLSVKEANAIGTAYLRVDELPDDSQPEMRRLFREYLKVRLETQRSLPDIAAAERGMARSSQVQQQIWSTAVAGSRKDPTQNAARLLLPAINDMIDVTTERAIGFRSLLAGYGMAKRRTRSLLHMILFAACISATIFAVTDLEHPRSGLIRVNDADRTLVELQDLIH
jgi:hypothetical protein